MLLLTLFITAILVLIASALVRKRSRQNTCKRPIRLKMDPAPLSSEEPPTSLNPFLIFNSVNIDKTFTILKGTWLSENLYIADGVVDVLLDGSRIGVLKKGEITFNCFDLLGLSVGITKRAATDILVAKVPVPADPYVSLKILEKVCFVPSLRLCRSHSQIARLETLRTGNFEVFLQKSLKMKCKAEEFAFKESRDIEDGLIYISSGALDINGTVFGKGRIFGYFGIFFSYYKGFKASELSDAGMPTMLKYVPYDKLRHVVFNVRMMKNMPSQLIYLGATAQWTRVPSGYKVQCKGAKCEGVLLADRVELGSRECIMESIFESDYVTEKATDVIRIPRATLDYLLRTIPYFYSTFTRKIFEKSADTSKVILICPASGSCEVFVKRLHRTLFSESIVVRSTGISEVLGKHAFQKMGELILSEHLLSLRERYKVVIVYLENEYSRLLSIVSPMCDTIFMVGFDVCQNRFTRRNVEFIKLYERRPVAERKRSKIKSMLLSGLFFDNDSSDSDFGEMESKNLEISPLDGEGFPAHPSFKRMHQILSPKSANFCHKDFERLGRYLLGQRFGLVLGGGGARGFAHIGVIQALEEENIPIDAVGGTSMGAFVGALYARGLDYVSVYSQTKRLSRVGSSKWYFLADLTYPFASLFSGRSFDRTIRSIFKNQQIQNFWLEYYCVTTSLKSFDERVYFNGSAFKCIRASMTISGLIPPVFYNDDILCDGAYVNNVPVDVMSSLDVKNVISVNVGTSFCDTFDPYDSTSGIVLFFKSLFESKQYLSLIEMQFRLTFISTQRKARLLEKETLIIKPKLLGYKTSDFNKFDEIVACGYESAKAQIREWKALGKINEFKKRARRFSI